MKALLPILCLSLFVSRANAQLFTLVNKDSEPIEFANVLFYQNDTLVAGTYSTTKGEVYLSSELNFDKVVISHLSYNDTTINKEDITDVVALKRNKAMLDVVTVTSGDDLPLSYIGEELMRRSNTSMSVEKGLSLRILMLLSPEDKEAKRLKSFVFHAKRKKKHEPFYVKVVFFENNDEIPGKQIPAEIIASVVKQKNNRIVVDIEDESIMLPTTGLFVGIEFIGTEGDLSLKEVDLSDRESFLELMVNLVDISNSNATLFQSSLSRESNGWISYDDFFEGFNEGEILVPVFGVEVFD